MSRLQSSCQSSKHSIQSGFSLVEVLVGLVLSGLLMSMVATVMGQSITNNEVVRSSAGLSSRMFTLRRILHRDLQNKVPSKPVIVGSDGFSFVTANNFLIDGGVEVEASWDFSGNMIRRHELSEILDYTTSFQMLRGVKSWRLELLDGESGVWVSSEQYKNRALTLRSMVKALRINMVFEDGMSISLVERIPYATQ